MRHQGVGQVVDHQLRPIGESRLGRCSAGHDVKSGRDTGGERVVDLAYRVVVPRDAVAGIPSDYATSIIDNTLSLLATITTTDDLIEAWKQS